MPPGASGDAGSGGRTGGGEVGGGGGSGSDSDSFGDQLEGLLAGSDEEGAAASAPAARKVPSRPPRAHDPDTGTSEGRFARKRAVRRMRVSVCTWGAALRCADPADDSSHCPAAPRRRGCGLQPTTMPDHVLELVVRLGFRVVQLGFRDVVSCASRARAPRSRALDYSAGPSGCRCAAEARGCVPTSPASLQPVRGMVSSHSGTAPVSSAQARAGPGPVPPQARAGGRKAEGGEKRLPAEVEAEDAAELTAMRQAGFTRPGAQLPLPNPPPPPHPTGVPVRMRF